MGQPGTTSKSSICHPPHTSKQLSLHLETSLICISAYSSSSYPSLRQLQSQPHLAFISLFPRGYNPLIFPIICFEKPNPEPFIPRATRADEFVFGESTATVSESGVEPSENIVPVERRGSAFIEYLAARIFD